MDTSEAHRSNITDDELQLCLRQFRSETPALGERMIMGKLRSLGIRVSRKPVRTCIRVIDPINTVLRWRGHLARRQPYSVAGPNSLWHIGESSVYLSGPKGGSFYVCEQSCINNIGH